MKLNDSVVVETAGVRINRYTYRECNRESTET